MHLAQHTPAEACTHLTFRRHRAVPLCRLDGVRRLPTYGALHASPRTTTATGASTGGVTVRTDRATPRPLRPEVAAHLTAHPGKDFTPGEIAKVLRRSSGAVSNALDSLVKAALTSEKPHRYRAADTAPAPGAA